MQRPPRTLHCIMRVACLAVLVGCASASARRAGGQEIARAPEPITDVADSSAAAAPEAPDYYRLTDADREIGSKVGLFFGRLADAARDKRTDALRAVFKLPMMVLVNAYGEEHAGENGATDLVLRNPDDLLRESWRWLPNDAFLASVLVGVPRRGDVDEPSNHQQSNYTRGRPAAHRVGSTVVVLVDPPFVGAASVTYRYVLEGATSGFRIIAMNLDEDSTVE